MAVICGLNTPVDNLELGSDEAVETKPEFCVLRSPMTSRCVIARPGEQGTAGWQTLYGPDTSEGCWSWVRTKPSQSLRF